MTKQTELPQMPENSDLGNACAAYLSSHEDMTAIKDNLAVIGNRIIEELKKEEKVSIRFHDFQFSIKESAEKLQVSEVKK